MSILAATLFAFLPQDGAPASRPTQDRVLLRAGSALEGTITIESKDYLELKLTDGTTVGFEKKIVESIQRGVGAAAAEQRVAESKLLPRDRWYLLHDGEGKLRGRLHETLTIGEETRLSEEWQLAGDQGKTEVTVLEVLDGELRPLSCFVHERTSDAAGERMKSERVVRAKVVGNRLEVVTKTLRGDESRSYDLPAGTSFPLAAAELVRREVTKEASGTVTVFDPRCEEVRPLAWRCEPRRQVVEGKKTLDVRELRLTFGKIENLEWLDASGASVRREVNGPALVAVPTNADTARGVRNFGGDTGTSSVVREKGGRFGLWLPSPSWRADGDVQEGAIVARSAIDDASVTLVTIDHVDADLALDSVADTVARWMKLLRPELKTEKRTRSAVRGWPALLLESSHAKTAPGVSAQRKTRTWVFRAHGLVLALSCETPVRTGNGFEADLSRLLGMVEVVPAK